jgi:hypothetical protein
MGIQINGQTDTISAIDGALTVSGADLPTVTNLNVSGVTTTATLRATSIVGVTTAGITTAYIGSVNDGPLSGARNRIINGDCTINQRNAGVSVTGTGTYPLDRWKIEYSSNGAIAGIQTTDVPIGQGFTNSIRLTSTARSSFGSGDFNQLFYSIEGYNVSDLDFGSVSAKPITLSFWVKGSRVGTYNVQISNSGGSRTYTKQYTIPSPDTWQKVILTYPGCTDGTWLKTNGSGLEFRFGFEYGSTFTTGASADTWITASSFVGSFPTTTNTFMTNSNSTWQITGVQLEAGTVATPFERRSYGQELALCQRYFEIQDVRAVTTAYVAGGYNYHVGSVRWKVTKRTAPTTNTPSIANYQPGGGSGTASVSNQTVDGGLFLSGSTNTTFPNQWVNDNSILTISAEL